MSHLEVRAKSGEDKDGKPYYKTIGRVITTQKGQMLKLDAIPMNWDGWAYLNEPMPKDGAQKDTRTHGERKRPSFDDSDAPF